MFRSNQCAGIVGRKSATGREVMARQAALANEVRVVIIDAERAGIIGGPFVVWVIKGGKEAARHSFIATRELAEQRKAELEAIYVPRAA